MEPRAVLMSIEDQGTIMGLLDLQKEVVGFEELKEAFGQTQELLTRVAMYSQPIREVQMVCEHPQHLIDLQWQITHLQAKQFLPSQCNHIELERQIWNLTDGRDEARRRAAAPGTNEGRSQTVTCSIRNKQGTLRRTGRYDPGCTAICRGSPLFEDAVGECLDVGRQSGPGCSLGPRRQLPEISRLPGLFRVRSNSVERLDCSTPDGHMTQARQLSRWTVEDAVCIQPPKGSRLKTDFATHPGGRNDRAGRPTSFLVPGPSSDSRMESAGN